MLTLLLLTARVRLHTASMLLTSPCDPIPIDARPNSLHAFQFAPLKATRFGSSLTEYYVGTLFRFPLRTPATAKTSEIKSAVPDDSVLDELFAIFQAQALAPRPCSSSPYPILARSS